MNIIYTIVFSTLAVASTSTTFGASTTGYSLTFITIINNFNLINDTISIFIVTYRIPTLAR